MFGYFKKREAYYWIAPGHYPMQPASLGENLYLIRFKEFDDLFRFYSMKSELAFTVCGKDITNILRSGTTFLCYQNCLSVFK